MATIRSRKAKIPAKDQDPTADNVTLADKDTTKSEITTKLQGNGRVVISNKVVFKLVLFSLLMMVVPLGSYYLSVHFDFSPTFGGIVAAVLANVIAGLYCVSAFMETDD